MEDTLPALAQQCSFAHRAHLEQAAEYLTDGEIIVAGFHGVFGIFGNADSPEAAERIFQAKQRPKDKGLILVCPPEYIGEFVDRDAPACQCWYTLEQIQQLLSAVHALGVILPAAPAGAPSHLVKNHTILTIWTEYPPYHPFRHLVRLLRERGGRALVGTSANKSGCATCTTPEAVYTMFQDDAALCFLDTFDHLPPVRRVSTSVIDLTGDVPRLHREGSMLADEIDVHLRRLGFPALKVSGDVIRLHPSRQ
jgi:L-threonylcarbamoyladenylate synthase